MTRLAFANAVLRMSNPELREKYSMGMDGTVIPLPPRDQTERMNFCKNDDEFMWRKASESFKADLAGDDPYPKQLPLSRALPLWGGISAGGFAVVSFHKQKKFDAKEWVQVVDQGGLTDAVKQLGPVNKKGPWHVLCDNESFLTAKLSTQAYKRSKVKLWRIPAKSPDLNPIERFWSHLKKHLRKMDLADALKGRPVLGKTAYKQRVRRVVATKKMQDIAKKCALSLKKVCREVVKQKGKATGL